MRSWVLLCPFLHETGGHEADYVLRLGEAARRHGDPVRVLLPHGSDVRLDGLDAAAALLPVWSRPPGGGPASRLFNKFADAFQTARRQAHYRRMFAAATDTTWLLHTAPLPEIGIVMTAFRQARAQASGNRLKVTIRADHHDDPRRIAQFTSVLAQAGPGVDLFADTPELADMLGRLSPVPVLVVPIPGLDPVETIMPRPWTFGYFGLRRLSKGFHHLPGILAMLPSGHSFHAVVHSTAEVDVAENHDAVEAALRAGGVSLLSEHLSADAYRDALMQTEILLLPYSDQEYRNGSSGVFIDALKAGCSVIIPKGTSMAGEAVRARLPQAHIVDFSQPSDVATAVARAVSERPDVRLPAEEWLERHSPSGVWKALRQTSAM